MSDVALNTHVSGGVPVSEKDPALEEQQIIESFLPTLAAVNNVESEQGLVTPPRAPRKVKGGFDDTKPPGLVERIFCGCFPYLVRLILCTSVGSFLFGYNLALLNTSLNTISAEFGWCDAPGDISCNGAVLKQAFVKTAVFIGAALGAMTGGEFMSIGRRMVFLVNMALFTIGIVSSVTANSFSAILWARLLVGYGVGVVSVVVPTYMAEMTPPGVRGFYGVFHQLFVTIGIFIAVLIGMPLHAFPDNDQDRLTFELPLFDKIWWRVMLGLGIVPVLIGVYFMAFVMDFETPHYYVENDKLEDAEKLLKKIQKRADVSEDLHKIVKARDVAESAKEKGLTLFQAMKQPMYRHVILFGCVFSAFQQFTGINVFIAGSNSLFESAGLDRSLATIMSVVLTAVNVLMTFPAIYLIEKLGRRSLMLIGTLGMSLSLLPGAVLLWVQEDSVLARWLSISGSIPFIIFFAISYGPVLWVYLFEIYPIEIKGMASGVATAANWISGIGMVFVTSFIGVKINFTIFCAMSFIAAVIVFIFMRETKGRSLEDSPFMTKAQ